MKTFKILLFLTFFCACKNTNSPDTPKNPAPEVDTLVYKTTPKKEEITYYAKVDELRLRKEAAKKGAVVEKIKEGGKLIFLNETTDFKDKIKLRNRWYEEPWLKVKSERGNEGWVFGGAVTSVAPEEEVSKLPYDQCELAFLKNGNFESWTNCYEKVAKKQMAKDTRYIKPTATGYEVTLLSGETRTLFNETNPEAGEGYRKYNYRYYLDRIGYFVFRIDRGEGGDYILMDDKFGYAMPIYGMPRLSPDLKKMIITNTDQGAGFEYNGIQLMGITEAGLNPEPIFEEEIEKFMVLNPVWVDENKIEFDFITPANASEKLKVKATLSADENGDWNLSMRNIRE